MAEIIVTSTDDSGSGSLRQAIADAADGDVILFDPAIFPVGQTTTIYLSSYLSVNKSIGIYGGVADGNGGYTSGATITRYVVRTVNDVETEVVVDDNHPALEGETVLFHVTTRVALDGQSAQESNAADEWSGWTGTRIGRIEASNVTIAGITFQNGLSITSEIAPLLTCYGSGETQVAECAFLNGINTNNYAGGCNASMNAMPVFTRCEWRNCRAKGPAGAYYTVSTGKSEFNDCSFVGCQASSGGVLHSHLTSQNEFNNCLFYGNTSESGGVGYLSSDSQNEFNDCVVDSGTATTSSAAFYCSQYSQNTFTRCLFQNLTAPSGSAFYSTGLTKSSLTDCVIKNCSGATGGFIYTMMNGRMELTRCSISNCTANTGGAFYLNSSSRIILTDCEISDCSALSSQGGGAYVYAAGVIVLRGTTFRRCYAKNSTTSGGGIYINSGGRIFAGDSESGAKTRFIDCSFGSNSHGEGSAIRTASIFIPDLSAIVCENCAHSFYPNPGTPTVRYFTTNADSGEGSFRAVLATCGECDTIRPDPTVFPVGSVITIQLSSTLETIRRLFIEGHGRRIVFDAQETCPCFLGTPTLSFADCDFVNGYASSGGAAISSTANGNGMAFYMTRCRVAGCKGPQILQGRGSSGGCFVSSIIEGNYCSSYMSNACYAVGVGTVCVGNYGSNTTFLYLKNYNAINNVTPSKVGFKTPPPDTLAAENWNADLWKSWDLTLRDDSTYKSGAAALDEIDALVAGDGAKCDIEGCPRKPSGSFGAYEDRTGIQLVTTTADSGAGSLRSAIAAAQDGDVVLFSYVTFPKGDTTVIPLNSYLTVNKSVDIYGGYWDTEAEGYSSGATITRYVEREINGVETEVVVDDDNPALENEVVLMHVTTRVALDGQATQDPNHTDDFDGWTGTPVLHVAAPTDGECISTISGITGQYGLQTRTEYGGILTAIEWANATLDATFVDCAFLHGVNTSGIAGLVSVRGTGLSPHARFTRCEFRDGRSNGGGGCAYVRDDAVVTFDDCSFVEGVSQSYGGGFYAQIRGITTFTDCAFWKCVASTAGGTCAFNNEAQATLTRCVLAKGSASSGGGIDTNVTATATLNNCVVRDCECVNNGGAFYLYANSSVTANNCVIDGCSAKYGGGEYSNNSSVFTATECTFSNCSATTNGGAICSYSPVTQVFDSCVFTGNSCVSAGGAVVSYSRSVLEFNDCEFSNNTASSGGAIATYNYSQTVLVTCDFGHNTANGGGSFYFTNFSRNVLRNCVVHDCSMLAETGSGGAIACTNTPHNEYYSCEFRDCTAYNAGVMYANGSSSNRFVDCSFTDISSSNIGGAIYCIYNTLTVLDGCTFLRCSSQYGGTAQIYGSSRFYVRDATTFEQCEATGRGGALRCMGAVKLEIDDTVSFVDCAAPQGQGSAVLSTSLYRSST